MIAMLIMAAVATLGLTVWILLNLIVLAVRLFETRRPLSNVRQLHPVRPAQPIRCDPDHDSGHRGHMLHVCLFRASSKRRKYTRYIVSRRFFHAFEIMDVLLPMAHRGHRDKRSRDWQFRIGPMPDGTDWLMPIYSSPDDIDCWCGQIWSVLQGHSADQGKT